MAIRQSYRYERDLLYILNKRLNQQHYIKRAAIRDKIFLLEYVLDTELEQFLI